MPVRLRLTHLVNVRDPVQAARRIVREQHPLRVALGGQLDHRVDPLIERQNPIQTEPVQPHVRPAIHQRLQVVRIRRVADMANHDPRQVTALVLENVLLQRAQLRRTVMRRNRHARRSVRASARAQALLVVAVHPAALLVRRQLDDVRLDRRARNPLLNLLHKHPRQLLRRSTSPIHRAQPVDPSAQDDVDLRHIPHLLQEPHVPPQISGRQVNHRAHPPLRQRRHLLLRRRHAASLVPQLRPVLRDARRANPNVLVNQRATQLRRIQLAAQRVNRWHLQKPFLGPIGISSKS